MKGVNVKRDADKATARDTVKSNEAFNLAKVRSSWGGFYKRIGSAILLIQFAALCLWNSFLTNHSHSLFSSFYKIGRRIW
jgi:hypothetical protein